MKGGGGMREVPLRGGGGPSTYFPRDVILCGKKEARGREVLAVCKPGNALFSLTLLDWSEGRERVLWAAAEGSLEQGEAMPTLLICDDCVVAVTLLRSWPHREGFKVRLYSREGGLPCGEHVNSSSFPATFDASSFGNTVAVAESDGNLLRCRLYDASRDREGGLASLRTIVLAAWGLGSLSCSLRSASVLHVGFVSRDRGCLAALDLRDPVAAAETKAEIAKVLSFRGFGDGLDFVCKSRDEQVWIFRKNKDGSETGEFVAVTLFNSLRDVM